MPEGRDLVSDVQVHDSEESLLKLLDFSLPLVFFLGAVIQRFFQGLEHLPESAFSDSRSKQSSVKSIELVGASGLNPHQSNEAMAAT